MNKVFFSFAGTERNAWGNGCLAAGAIAAAIILIHSAGAVLLPAEPTYPILSACSGSTIVFPPRFLPLKDPISRLKTDYHRTVDTVITAHLDEKKVQCSQGVFDRPSEELAALATKLPPWRNTEDQGGLRETDIGSVLLEYLRIYECTLKEHAFFAPNRIAHQISVNNKVSIPEHTQEIVKRLKTVREEVTFSRKALDRTLTLVGGLDRLRPLDNSLLCLQQSSLDIRNILGLAADTASCIPRIWDARGSLRQLPSKP